MPHPQIKFGTDGWRGVIADDFTFANVRTAAEAIAAYIHAEEDPRKGLAIAYDTRFGSKSFASACAEVVAATGIPVQLANAVTPTPALSFGVRERGAAGGIMITSSHNPAQWNGVKYKGWYGGSGKPSMITAIESYLGQPVPRASQPAPIIEVDFLPTYLKAIENFADLDLIAKSGMKFCIDSMYGAGGTILSDIFNRIGVANVPIRFNPDPLFPGINPEPIEPNIRALGEATVANHCQAGLCTDGDADRIGATDENGNFVDPHKIYSVLLSWVLKYKGWPGAVTRAFNTTKMLDRIAKKYDRELIEHGIGFKYVVDLMLEREIVMGGEESGGIGFQRHLPERDGLLNCLLARQRHGSGRQDPRPACRRSASRVRRASIRPHRSPHLRRAEERRHRPRPRTPNRRHHLRRHAHPAPGKSRRREVLPRQSRSQNQAQRRRNLAAPPRQRHRAAHAHLHRILLQRICRQTPRIRAQFRIGQVKPHQKYIFDLSS